MIDWIFTLNPDTDAIVAEEPAGWDNISLKLKRDRRMHGISIAFSVTELTFDGEAALFIKEQYDLYGVDADVKIKIQAICDDEEQYMEIFALDFNRYNEMCGNDCRISIGFEQISCFSKFTNNYDKKVDIENTTALDSVTSLTALTTLEKNIVLQPKAIRLRDEATTNPLVTEDLMAQISWVASAPDGAINPALQNIVHSALGSFQPSTFPEWHSAGGATFPPYDTMAALVNTTELLGEITCGLQDVFFEFRLKGTINITNTNTTNFHIKLFRLPVGLDPGTPANWVEEYTNNFLTVASPGGSFPYDEAATIPLTIQQGDLLYFYIYVDFTVSAVTVTAFSITQETDSFIILEATTVCQESSADTYLIFETLHRLAEATTGKCLELDSEWYGRTDSEPKSYVADGCGSLKVLTNGLKLRNTVGAKFFISMKETLEELNKIDSIGFALTKDSSGNEILKVEEAGYFYNESELLRLQFVAGVKRSVVQSEVYGILRFGYEKWQIEQLAGLDEFNSTREYRSSLQNASGTFDFTSKFVAAGYVIEITRQQSYAASGAADTKWDDSTFIITVMRSYGDIVVEQGGITNPANMFHPDSVYNFRISPYRNLLRWFNMLAGHFPDLTLHSFRFSSGTGNYIAQGWLMDDCSPENAVHGESASAGIFDINNSTAGTPKFKPESVTFEYPMSLADFNQIRANPYGYISYQCGTLEWHKGYIFDIDYKISSGVATFDLREKYTQ